MAMPLRSAASTSVLLAALASALALAGPLRSFNSPLVATALRERVRPPPPASLVGREWTALPTKRRVVALTFDGGANADGAALVLRTLRRARVPGTFFLTGRFACLYPRIARAIATRYPIGNHTYDHPHMTALSDAGARNEIQRAGRTLRRITHRDPRPLFRFPYGDSNRRLIEIANRLGYGAIGWTIDTLGWEGTAQGQSVRSVIARVRRGLCPGAIVLMHLRSAPDGSTLDAHALARVIAVIRARGYGFVTVSQFVRRGKR
jgi:peptidoglycan/xylan/chitin deacetylase (PgdA/CDA1 family)